MGQVRKEVETGSKNCPLLIFVCADNADNLKELFSRAQGEVSIREALRELDLWGAGANFSLTGYTDSAAKELSIIKDWKELVNQVSPVNMYTCTFYHKGDVLISGVSFYRGSTTCTMYLHMWNQ